jgi:predicted lactoylglutathione lyase
MSTTQAPAPKLTNVGTKPATPRKLFVNIPVSDLQRSIDFFEALGFTFNAQFTDATATAMLVGEDAYGAHALDPQDHGFMYGWSFYDPDGHHWEVFWMDPSVPVQ